MTMTMTMTMPMTMTMAMTLTKAYLKHGQGSLHAEDSGLRAGLQQEQLLVVTAQGTCSLAPEGVFIIRAAKYGDPYLKLKHWSSWFLRVVLKRR
jgi:hypothetical protein